MSRTSQNLSILVRTERLIARRRLTVLRTQTGLMAFAGVVAGLGLIMLNVAGFLMLQDRMSGQAAAGLVALIDLALAVVMVWYAARIDADRDLEPVVELRDAAIAELEHDLELAVDEARDLTKSVRQVVSDPLGSLLPSLIGPLIAILSGGKKK
ncbi:phage holin family protein [Sedimentitalea arenosa]|uniref:Phage holin family protein n=1 Tax=Sedimentitalea arenosa TaxID=2798803 RepID=A0A8J7J7K9_9RHOB|nr:phage holin family protein [Arenibacterium arenosum]MBJ6370538.1 phage holin family protein [Arenibacterium arenosum]